MISDSINQNQWLRAYLNELEYFTEVLRNKYVKSIFFGGGTPSLMPVQLAAQVINKIAQLAMVDKNTEITLEANPTSFEVNKFREFAVAGINRVSVGVQSLRDHDLQTLGRQHSVSQAKYAIECASKIFKHISFDLIYARSGQTIAAWQAELAEALSIADGHISLYQLNIEKGTRYYRMLQEGQLELPDNDTAAAMYEWSNAYLIKHGYNRYEISNYAQAGQECVHSLCYWHYKDYIGIGPGAHGRIMQNNIVYAVNMKYQPYTWLQNVINRGNGIQKQNALTLQTCITEFLMMGLRLEQGVNTLGLQRFSRFRIKDIVDAAAVSYHRDLGLLIGTDDELKLTAKGLMLHNYILPRIIADTIIAT